MTLSIRNLSIHRSEVPALSDVSAALEQGQIIAICGPNGAGKSSMLMALAGLLDPSSGAVLLDDADISALHPRARAQRIGYLPQEASVAWDVSVANLVRLGRMPWRDRGEDAVERAIAALDLQSLRNRPASQLSGGERARVLLARVLAGEPDWILADEPLAALDLGHQLTMLRHLRCAAKGGKGVVLVLHDLALAMNHADRVLVLQEGRLIADGPPEKSLSSDIIADVWGVTARWLGEPGALALVTGQIIRL